MLKISKLKETNIKKNLVKQGDFFNEIKYHPAATKEWYNSIYNFNKIKQKDVPSLDITVLKIIKNYFRMFSYSLERNIFMYRKSLYKRKLKLNKVFIGKPEFKHTNDKVTITLYVYNRELTFLNLKIKKVRGILLSQYFFKIIANKLTVDNILHAKNITNYIFNLSKEVKILYEKKNSLLKNLESNKLKSIKTFFFNKYNGSILKRIYLPWSSLKWHFNILKKKGLINVGKSILDFESKINESKNLKNVNISINDSIYLSNTFFYKYLNTEYLNKYINKFVNQEFNPKFSEIAFYKTLKKIIFRMKLYVRLNRIIRFSKLKFNLFLNPLKIFLESIYKKEVEFNIISLKSYNLDSNLLSQVISTKLKNRKVKLSRLVKKALSKIKLPISRRYEYSREIIRNKRLQNIILKLFCNKKYLYKYPILNIYTLNKRIVDKRTNINLKEIFYTSKKSDRLDNIIKSLYPSQNILKKDNKIIYKRNLENTVLDSIKKKFIGGIRIELSGRLSKRIVAARSMSFIKQKGTIRNINSSYKKIPSILLRGNFRSSLQFSNIKNKTRIGSFGLKGWVNSV